MGGTVVIGDTSEPNNLYHPGTNPIGRGQNVQHMINAALLRIVEDGALQPYLATEVPTVANKGISSDGLTYTVRLRPSAVWQDGKPVTSKDFAYTWKSIMDPKQGAQQRLGWERITSIDTPDDKTAVIHLDRVYAPFVPVVLAGQRGGGFLLPEHVYSQYPVAMESPLARMPVGNGPFMVTEWVSGTHLTLLKNPRWWGEPVAIDKIVYKFVPDNKVLIAQLRTGEVDIAYDMSEGEMVELRGVRGVVTYGTPSTTIEQLTLNLNDPKDLSKPHPINSDINVRKAIAYGFDREKIINTILYGIPKPAVSDFSNTPFAHPTLKPYPYDPERARKLLDEAGWVPGPDGIRVKEGRRLATTISTTSGNPPRESIEVIIQDQLKQIGIDVKIVNYRSNDLFGGCGKVKPDRRYDMVLGTRGLAGVDYDNSNYWHSKLIPDCANKNPTGGNEAGLRSPELDQLLEAQAREFDEAKRRQLLYKIQEIIYEAYAVIFVYPRHDIIGANERVKGIRSFMRTSGHIFSTANEWWVTDGK